MTFLLLFSMVHRMASCGYGFLEVMLSSFLRARGVALLDCMIERASDMGVLYGWNDLAFMATESVFLAWFLRTIWVAGVFLLSSIACIPNSSRYYFPSSYLISPLMGREFGVQ